MDTYFVEKGGENYAKRRDYSTMKVARTEARPRTCKMTPCDQSCGCLVQGRIFHPFDDSGYTRVPHHHSSDEMVDVLIYDATILHHTRKNGGGGYWGC